VSKRRFRLKWFAVKRAYYGHRYGRPIGGWGGGMMPQFGKGQFVSVHQRGPFLEMHDERTSDLIRLVPYQPNHGVMVEMWRNGKLAWCGHCDFNAFRRMGFDQSERAA
jgi:hypothetical protein